MDNLRTFTTLEVENQSRKTYYLALGKMQALLTEGRIGETLRAFADVANAACEGIEPEADMAPDPHGVRDNIGLSYNNDQIGDRARAVYMDACSRIDDALTGDAPASERLSVLAAVAAAAVGGIPVESVDDDVEGD